ncbi:MAG: hypothetical protein EBV01_03540 [Betaproteobacteria bacterium]|nr:hypothetical protein [Betaproteobacteria bacterium]
MPRGPGLLAHRIEICRVPGWIDATQRSLEESLNGMTQPQDSCRGQLPKLALYPVTRKNRRRYRLLLESRKSVRQEVSSRPMAQPSG